MATIRNTSPSTRRIRDGRAEYVLHPRVDVQIPDDVMARYRQSPGHEALFARGILVDKSTTRVVRHESGLVSAPLADADTRPIELIEDAPVVSPTRRRKREVGE